jgi:hypothetical protein
MRIYPDHLLLLEGDRLSDGTQLTAEFLQEMVANFTHSTVVLTMADEAVGYIKSLYCKRDPSLGFAMLADVGVLDNCDLRVYNCLMSCMVEIEERMLDEVQITKRFWL